MRIEKINKSTYRRNVSVSLKIICNSCCNEYQLSLESYEGEEMDNWERVFMGCEESIDIAGYFRFFRKDGIEEMNCISDINTWGTSVSVEGRNKDNEIIEIESDCTYFGDSLEHYIHIYKDVEDTIEEPAMMDYKNNEGVIFIFDNCGDVELNSKSRCGKYFFTNDSHVEINGARNITCFLNNGSTVNIIDSENDDKNKNVYLYFCDDTEDYEDNEKRKHAINVNFDFEDVGNNDLCIKE